jgi:hypothetical protein
VNFKPKAEKKTILMEVLPYARLLLAHDALRNGNIQLFFRNIGFPGLGKTLSITKPNQIDELFHLTPTEMKSRGLGLRQRVVLMQVLDLLRPKFYF